MLLSYSVTFCIASACVSSVYTPSIATTASFMPLLLHESSLSRMLVTSMGITIYMCVHMIVTYYSNRPGVTAYSQVQLGLAW